MVTDGEKDTMSPNSRQQLLNEESQKSPTDDRQIEIMNHEQAVQFECWAILHELPSAKDYDIVCHQNRGCFLEGRHRRHAIDECEILGGVALD